MVNERVHHNIFGEGTIIDFYGDTVVVKFDNQKEMKLAYPGIFEKGIMRLRNKKKQAEIFSKIIKESARIKKIEYEAFENDRLEREKLLEECELFPRGVKGNERFSFIVFQGGNYQIEQNKKYIVTTSEDDDEVKSTCLKYLLDVASKDIIFHYFEGNISAISIVKDDNYLAAFSLIDDGVHSVSFDRSIHLETFVLEQPLSLNTFKFEIQLFGNRGYSSFSSYDNQDESYLFQINLFLSKLFLNWIVTHNIDIKSIGTVMELLEM